MQRTVIVTGSSGGIGTKICEAFKAENWTVIGIDKSNAFKTHCDHHITLDLEDLGTKNDIFEEKHKNRGSPWQTQSDTLINNAGFRFVVISISLPQSFKKHLLLTFLLLFS